jgi:hypothetical protein
MPTHRTRRALVAGIAVWLLAALAVTLSGVLAKAAFLVPLAIGGITLAAVMAYRASPGFRRVASALEPRAIVWFHVVRAPIGVLFLIEQAHGNLPALFAERAGYGDIFCGVLAAGIAAFAMHRPRVVLAWNVLGLVDIAVAVVTAQYLLVLQGDPQMTAALQRFPYGLLPTFIVPAVVLSHLLMFARLRRPAAIPVT